MATSGSPFEVHIDSDQRLVICLEGELDLAMADELVSVVEAHRPLTAAVLLDVARITFVDSSGIRALVETRTLCLEDTGEPPRLVRPSEQLRRVLALAGLTDEFVSETGSHEHDPG